jgi:hypothetical protein
MPGGVGGRREQSRLLPDFLGNYRVVIACMAIMIVSAIAGIVWDNGRAKIWLGGQAQVLKAWIRF